MIVLHAIWDEGTLHLWGERCPAGTPDAARPADDPDLCTTDQAQLAGDQELKRILGDRWDSLLISGALSSHLTLRLPHSGGRIASSVRRAESFSDVITEAKPRLISCLVPTLCFGPADAIDLLTGTPTSTGDQARAGDSLKYWSRVAALVTELLAKQRFVPALHRAGEDRYRGYWRVVVGDRETSDRLRSLIVSMPPVCRSLASEGDVIQAAGLVENFLWTTVDALVRRCMEGDELTHAVVDRPAEGSPLRMRWLKSLILTPPTLHGAAEECKEIHERVVAWLSGLEPAASERSCRTYFCLHPPAANDAAAGEAEKPWRLTLQVQATHDPTLVVDAHSLWGERSDDPTILARPFAGAHEQLRADVARAARHFPPLAASVEPDGPLECALTLDEAYRFLRDTVPVLRAEGFGVSVPQWWRDDRPRLRMCLDIRPLDDQASAPGGTMGLDTLVAFDWRIAAGDDDLSREEMTELARAKQPLVRLRDQWVEVAPSDMEQAMDFVDKNKSGRMTVFEALRLSYAADDLETGLPVAGLYAHGWIDKLLNAADLDEQIEDVSSPAGFYGTLREYQLRGLRWLSFHARHGLGACLADDMGLGKTIQLIALWLHEREAQASPGPTLLIVPMSLVGNWQREIAKFAPSLKAMVHHGLERLTGREFVDEVTKHDVVISTYGLAHRDLEHLLAVQWYRVALDEAQNIKNPAAKQSAAIRSLPSVHRLALTGTPLENRLSDLWSIMDFLNRGYLGTATDFRRRFALPVEKYGDADRAGRLRSLIRPFVLRRLKDDPGILDELPAKLEMTVLCNLTREQAALYEAVVSQMLGNIGQSGGIQRRGLILAAIVKLKQICNHPAHFLGDGSALAHRSGKSDRLTEMLEEVVAEGHRALVFTQFRVMGTLLQKHLEEALGVSVLFLHGGTSQPQRVRLVDRFQAGDAEPPIFILSLKAGGFGLNLTAANHVFHFDRWWNPAVEDQATDRVHRIGQEKQVQVHKFVCVGTFEERTAALLERKRSLADRIVGSGEEWLTELSTDALRELFTLSREAVAED